MAIKFLAGNRMQGTDAERLALTTEAGLVTAGGGWKELDRNTTSHSGTTNTISVTWENDPNPEYLMVLYKVKMNDSTEGDCFRAGYNGSLESNTVYSSNAMRFQGSNSFAQWGQTGKNKGDFFGFHPARAQTSDANAEYTCAVQYVSNPQGSNKLAMTFAFGHAEDDVNSGGYLSYGKTSQCYAQSDQADTIGLYFNQAWAGSGKGYLADSEIIVLGWDPTDTHTNNYWQQLATASNGSDSNTLETAHFDKKKWLWVQAYLTADDNNTLDVQMNASINNSSNYIGISPNSDQYYTWNNGRNAELTTTLGSNNYQSSAFNWKLNPTGSGFRYGHLNMWIHNEEGQNKRMCYQLTGSSSSTGAGSGQFYQEGWGFLDDLAVEQITRLRFTEATSGVEFDQDSVVTVWGAD